ncbi:MULTISPECIES: hypothetical protein [Nocardia]|uniref:hypothetical protein n=1 Tax=Nocardia TaxID=1817 RepID=UPI0018E5320F|nr:MULTISPECIES: hypothetical protein [Nocardia]
MAPLDFTGAHRPASSRSLAGPMVSRNASAALRGVRNRVTLAAIGPPLISASTHAELVGGWS